MLFGLVQYCIEFFTCTNVMQVTILFSLEVFFLLDWTKKKMVLKCFSVLGYDNVLLTQLKGNKK